MQVIDSKRYPAWPFVCLVHNAGYCTKGAEMDRGSRWDTAHHILAILAFTVSVPCWSQEPVPDDGGQRNRVVLVSLVDRKLAVVDNGVVIATFQVAVGARLSPSPSGEFTIISRVSNPTYYHRGTIIPTGKDNPVGTRWVGLNLKGYGIHGTNAPASIGRAASHGCIRLRNRDMERLFTMLRVGDVVRIRGERDVETAQIFGGESDETVVASAASASQTAEQQEATQNSVGLGKLVKQSSGGHYANGDHIHGGGSRNGLLVVRGAISRGIDFWAAVPVVLRPTESDFETGAETVSGGGENADADMETLADEQWLRDDSRGCRHSGL